MARRVQSTPGMLSVGTLDPTRATPAHYGPPTSQCNDVEKGINIKDILLRFSMHRTPDDGDDDTSDVNQSWGMGGLIVPKRVDRHQSRLQRDRFSIRDFALHIQDLRLIFQEVTKTMNRTSQKTSGDYVEHSPSVLRVIETAQVLLDVAEHADEPTADLFDLESSPSPTDSEFPTKDSARKITPRHIKVLIDLMSRAYLLIQTGRILN
ncbi:hypothetical protein BASA60_008611 [Batrachochytrium salamandrivorans]|nr:hypothetical protein BASA60_008611 [Batrachochytrium salamandrivorans]